jgi:hypothetical protein
VLGKRRDESKLLSPVYSYLRRAAYVTHLRGQTRKDGQCSRFLRLGISTRFNSISTDQFHRFDDSLAFDSFVSDQLEDIISSVFKMPAKGAPTRLNPIRLQTIKHLRVRRPNQQQPNSCATVMSSVLSTHFSSALDVLFWLYRTQLNSMTNYQLTLQTAGLRRDTARKAAWHWNNN